MDFTVIPCSRSPSHREINEINRKAAPKSRIGAGVWPFNDARLGVNTGI